MTAHPRLISIGIHIAIIIATWLFNNVVTVMVTNLPAPTKDSTTKYKYWFIVANKIVGNLKRAEDSVIEDSPNWQDAADKYVQKLINDGVLAPGPMHPAGSK
jgi:hypothetical protein